MSSGLVYRVGLSVLLVFTAFGWIVKYHFCQDLWFTAFVVWV